MKSCVRAEYTPFYVEHPSACQVKNCLRTGSQQRKQSRPPSRVRCCGAIAYDHANIFLSTAHELCVDQTLLNPFAVLMGAPAQYMMSFLPLCENGVLCSVSKNFQDAAGTDCLWRGAFCQRFCWRQESDDCPPPPVAAITRRDNCRTGHIKVPSGVIDEATTSGGYKERFMRRLLDPQVQAF